MSYARRVVRLLQKSNTVELRLVLIVRFNRIPVLEAFPSTVVASVLELFFKEQVNVQIQQ